ncbi:MAG: hypothetical protein LBG15_00615 [Dysgonamonadaceae bacterium]|nr:hypothetical protein [Dysgonamonadaceae bacterium]
MRTKTYADGETILSLGSDEDYTSKFYNYPNNDVVIFTAHPEQGLLYTWPAATKRAVANVNEANNPAQQLTPEKKT